VRGGLDRAHRKEALAQPLSPKSDPRLETKLPDFIQRGKILIVRRQFQEAVKVCRLGLLAHPTFVEGRLVLSMALMALARHDEVLAEMRVALELSPDNPMAHLLKGEALYHKRDFEQAHEVLEYARSLDPSNEKVLKLLDEIDDVVNYGQEPGPRAKTETKVYPAQRHIPFAADPSDVLSHAQAFGDWEAHDQEDDEEPTANDEPPLIAPLRTSQQPVPPALDQETGEERFRAPEEEEDDEEYTTAPFLPPTHLGQRLKQLDNADWMEPTVSEKQEGSESSVIVRPEDLTVEEQSGLDKLVIDEPEARDEAWAEKAPGWESPRGTWEEVGDEWTEREDLADERWSSLEPPAQDPIAAFKTPAGGGPVFEEDPTLVPGQSNQEVPPPLAALGDERSTDLEEPTVIPGRHRAGPLRPASTASLVEEEEDDDTVVNADAISSQALFGDEDEEVAPDPAERGWAGMAGARSPHDPTKALDVDSPFLEAPGESGVEVEVLGDDEGTRELSPDALDESTPAHEVSSADIYSGEIDELPLTPPPDPFAAAILVSDSAAELDEGDLSEISVEMLPDEAEMPPLPLDANSSLYDLSVGEAIVPSAPALPSEVSLGDEEDSHATRVNFDVPQDEPHAEVQLDPYAAPYADQGPVDPLAFEPVGEARRYVDPPGAYDGAYDDQPVDPYPAAAGPGMTYRLPSQDEDELSLEPADESGPLRWNQGPGMTVPLEAEEDGRAYPYPDDVDDNMGPPPIAREPTHETRPAGPQGLRGGGVRQSGGRAESRPAFGREASPPPPQPGGDGMLEQLTGDSGLFLRQANTEGRAAARIRRPQERHPDRTATSWLTILVGEPGSHRWIYLLLSAFGVLALAVAVGLAVRYYRLGEQIDAKRSQAQLRLHAGNMPDFMSAAQSYADILGRRGDDETARAAHARILAAIPFEFGDPIPQTSMKEGEPEGASADRVAAEAYTLLYGGSLTRAATRVLEADKQFPESAVLPYLAGRIALLEGSAGTAVRHLERAQERDGKDALILRALGLALAAQGKSDAALLAFRKALAINPDHIASLLGKAQTLIATRQLLDEAQVDLNTIVVGKRKILASRGQRGWAYLLLARLYFNKGQLDQAKHHISRAKSNMPSRDAPFLDELAGVLIDAFQLGEAENAIKQSIKIMKERPHPYLHMARIHLLHGRPRAALAELNRAKGLQYAASNLLRAKILLELGQLDRADKEVDHALGMAEDLLDAHIVKARVLAAKGQGRDAEAKLEDLLRKHPRNATLLTASGEILLKLGRLPDARAKFQEAIAYDKQAFGARLRLAEVFMSEGRFSEARTSLADAVRSNPGNIMVLMKQAELELDMGDLAEAATNYYEAHRRAPNDANIRLELARVLTLQRKLRQAEKEVSAAEAHGASRDVLALARGRLALYENNAGLAVSSLITATKGRPADMEGWTLLVSAYLMNNDTASAQQAANEMASRFPNTPEAVAAAARVDLNEGQSSHAVRRLGPLLGQLSRSARPPRDRADLLVLLGRAFQDNGKLSEAAAKYEEALKVCPLCPEPHYRRGLVQDERGQVEEAIASLKKAVSLDPLYSEVYYDLGQVYERSGQTAAAIESYQKYLTFNPPRDLARAAEEAIRGLKGGGY